MAESDTLIHSLNDQLNTLRHDLAKANTDAKNRRQQLRKAESERDAHAATVASLTTERDNLAAQAKAAPSELQTKLDEANGKLRERVHQDRFNEFAEAAGAKKEALPVLWRHSEYKADADTVDEAKLSEAIAKAKADPGLSLLFGETPREGQDGADAPKKPLTTGVDGSRGLPDRNSSRFRVRESQLADFAWKKANQKAINEARASGTFELLEGQ